MIADTRWARFCVTVFVGGEGIDSALGLAAPPEVANPPASSTLPQTHPRN